MGREAGRQPEWANVTVRVVAMTVTLDVDDATGLTLEILKRLPTSPNFFKRANAAANLMVERCFSSAEATAAEFIDDQEGWTEPEGVR